MRVRDTHTHLKLERLSGAAAKAMPPLVGGVQNIKWLTAVPFVVFVVVVQFAVSFAVFHVLFAALFVVLVASCKCMKRTWYQNFIDDYFDDSFSDYMSSSSSSSSAMNADPPAVDVGIQYLASARYRGNVRERMPTVMANGYLAIKKQFVVAHDLNANEQYEVRSSDVNANELQRYEANFTPANIIGTGVLASTCYGAYDEFRIRAVRVSFSSQAYNKENDVHLEHFIWWCGNHWEYDAESATDMSTYRQLMSVKDTGEQVDKIGSRPDAGFSYVFVPQVQVNNTSLVSPIYQDVPCPWLPTSEANRNIVLRGPIFIWRVPFYPPDNRLVAAYNVNYSCVIEFRNVDPGKL